MVMSVLLEEVLVIQGLAAGEWGLSITMQIVGQMVRATTEDLSLYADVDKVLKGVGHGRPGHLHDPTQNLFMPGCVVALFPASMFKEMAMTEPRRSCTARGKRVHPCQRTAAPCSLGCVVHGGCPLPLGSSFEI